jgi:DNA-binding NarL/FixJ family response regulator
MNDAADGGAIKVLLVDDHPIVREGYRRLLERMGDFRVVRQAKRRRLTTFIDGRSPT